MRDILKKLPNGIDTIIGSQGIYLSGGETQRISIARAILKDAPIVVLDEATAYADPENEHQIQKAFDGLIKNKTVIMVAHRLSTVQDADQILVMKNGAIAESGTHSDLIKHQGEYAKMWDNYNKTVQWHIEVEVLSMLKRAFALSDQGAKDLAKGIIATACANLIQIIPASLLLMVVMMLLEKAAGTQVNVGRNIRSLSELPWCFLA